MSNSENIDGKEALDYFKNLTSDPADQIMSLQDMEKVIKFHEDELDAEDKRVDGTDEYPNYGDDFADMVYIARRLLDEIERLRKERDEARQIACNREAELNRMMFDNPKYSDSEAIAAQRGWDCFKENTDV